MTHRVMAVVSAALAMLLPACCEEGSGQLVRESRSVDSFSWVHLDVPGSLRLFQGPVTALKVRTDDNLIDRVRTRVHGGSLTVDTDDSECDCIDPTELVVEVSTPDLRGLRMDGSGDIVLPGPVETDELTLAIDGSGSISAAMVRADDVSLEIDGSGDIDLAVSALALHSRIDGSGHTSIAGEAGEHDISIDGSGDIDAYALSTGTTRVDIGGSGGCAVSAADVLEVTIDGSGDVSYCGQPEVHQSIDGSGGVRRASAASCN